MIHLGTHVTRGLPLPLRDLEDSLLEEVVPMAYSPVTWGPVGPPILAKSEMPVRSFPTRLWFKPDRLIVNLVLADADPLGVNQNVTFEEVGGLDDRKLVLCSRYSC